jgi:hypothetical protein
MMFSRWTQFGAAVSLFLTLSAGAALAERRVAPGTTARQPSVPPFEAFNDVGLAVKRAPGGAHALERKMRTQNEIKVASLAVPDGNHRLSSTPPLSLQSRAQEFLADYGRHVQADASDALAFYRENFADEVHYYYGRRVSDRKLVAEQRSFIARWPHRRYRIRADATHIACNDVKSYCDVSGKYDFRVSSRYRASHGVASFAFRVVFTPGGPKVVSQNGHVLSQR